MGAPGLQGGGFMPVRAGWSLGGAFQNAFNPAAEAFVGRVSSPGGRCRGKRRMLNPADFENAIWKR